MPDRSDRPSVSEFLGVLASANVGRANQLISAGVLVWVALVADGGEFWWTVAVLIAGIAVCQMGLLDAFGNGMAEGHRGGHECANQQGDGPPPLSISELVEWCQERNIPPQEIEKLIWRGRS